MSKDALLQTEDDTHKGGHDKKIRETTLSSKKGGVSQNMMFFCEDQNHKPFQKY